jgi:hypothetical protein
VAQVESFGKYTIWNLLRLTSALNVVPARRNPFKVCLPSGELLNHLLQLVSKSWIASANCFSMDMQRFGDPADLFTGLNKLVLDVVHHALLDASIYVFA